MPNFYDFSLLQNVKTLEISPIGWINPLTIEYGINNQPNPTYFWRVKGTRHTFTIPVLRLDYITSGDYGQHFSEVLTNFKEKDYNQWRSTNFITKWMEEYKSEFERYIL